MASTLQCFNMSQPHPEERAEGARLEGWPQAGGVLPSSETAARKRVRPPQDDGGACFAFAHNNSGASCTAYLYGLSNRSGSARASFLAASAAVAPGGAGSRPSLSALVTRWLS